MEAHRLCSAGYGAPYQLKLSNSTSGNFFLLWCDKMGAACGATWRGIVMSLSDFLLPRGVFIFSNTSSLKISIIPPEIKSFLCSFSYTLTAYVRVTVCCSAILSPWVVILRLLSSIVYTGIIEKSPKLLYILMEQCVKENVCAFVCAHMLIQTCTNNNELQQ